MQLLWANSRREVPAFSVGNFLFSHYNRSSYVTFFGERGRIRKTLPPAFTLFTD